MISRRPTSNAPSTSVATMINGVAVPRSNKKLRNTKPSATVISQITTPVESACGDRHARVTSQPEMSAIKNGRATSTTPEIPALSSWLRRPTATNSNTLKTSSASATATLRGLVFVVIFAPEVSDLIFAHHPAQSIL